MKENTKKALYELLKAVLAALVSFVTAICVVGCGTTTRATVTNNRENTTTTISISTTNTNSTSVDTDGQVELSKTK